MNDKFILMFKMKGMVRLIIILLGNSARLLFKLIKRVIKKLNFLSKSKNFQECIGCVNKS